MRIVFLLLCLGSSLSVLAQVNPFLAGDVLSVTAPVYGFGTKNDDEPNYIIPQGGRFQVIEKRGEGYLVQAIPEWTERNQTFQGVLMWADDQTRAVFSPDLQFVVYPSKDEKTGKPILNLVKREGPNKAPKPRTEQKNQQMVSNLQFSPEGDGAQHGGDGSSAEAPASEGPQFAQFKTKEGVRLRGGPGTDFEIRGSLPKGHVVDGIEVKGEWTKVRREPEEWVKSEFLEPLDFETPIKVSPADRPTETKETSDPKNCLHFKKEDYTVEKVRTFIKKQEELTKAGKIQGPDGYKAEFFKFFAPFALHLQEVSGYPASVTLAQWAEESFWGRSDVFKDEMNPAGVSCFKENSTWQNREIVFARSGKKMTVTTKCDRERPAREKAWYVSYKTFIDAGYAYVNNITDNPKKAESYAAIRAAIKNPKLGPSAKTNAVVKALTKYATNASYTKKIRDMVNSNGLTKYASMGVCK